MPNPLVQITPLPAPPPAARAPQRQQRGPKYRRTQASKQRYAHTRTTELDLRIIATLAAYHLLPTSLLTRLVRANARVVYRHLQKLFHLELLDRFHIPRPAGQNPGEFIYAIQSVAALDWLVESGWAETAALDYGRVRLNRARPYSDLLDPRKAEALQGRLLMVQHELMISRFHALLELACAQSACAVELIDWRQGSATHQWVEVPQARYNRQQDLWGNTGETARLPHRPDAFFTLRLADRGTEAQEVSFFYEADRARTSGARFQEKLRAHFHYVVKQRRHAAHYGVNRIRAVLIETLTPRWADHLRRAAQHPLVSGPRPSPLFWFTPSTLFTHGPQPQAAEPTTPYFWQNPGIVFSQIWATPVDETLYGLLD